MASKIIKKVLIFKKNNIIIKRSYELRQVPCPSGGIGRRTGLKILRALNLVPVQVRPRAPFILPRSQVVRHQTLTLTCVSSNLTEAAIFIVI